MRSSRPKVLHEAAGRPLVYYPVRAALEAGAGNVVVVVGPGMEATVAQALRAHLPGAPVQLALQQEARGTGDAVRSGLTQVDAEKLVILSGDTPLLTAEVVARLVEGLADPVVQLCFLSALVDDPTGYGRVLRSDGGAVQEIREHRDLRSDAERAVREVNAGVYAARSEPLRRALAELRPDNAQGEYYLTDVVARLAGTSEVRALLGAAETLVGVNDRAQLQAAEELLFERIARGWGARGVTCRGRVLIDDTVELGEDVLLEDGVRLRGNTRVGTGTTVDVGSVLTDAAVGSGALIKPYSVIAASSVGDRAQIGPFAHLRPDSTIEEDAHVGNFVETKKTLVRKGAKANHLAYLGDGDVGEGANLGAGTIFCNYDGFRKHRTVIGAGAFVGSDSQLIAPVHVGARAYVATGTSVTEDVPEDGFAIGRCRQTTKAGYAATLRKRLDPSQKG